MRCDLASAEPGRVHGCGDSQASNAIPGLAVPAVIIIFIVSLLGAFLPLLLAKVRNDFVDVVIKVGFGSVEQMRVHTETAWDGTSPKSTWSFSILWPRIKSSRSGCQHELG